MRDRPEHPDQEPLQGAAIPGSCAAALLELMTEPVVILDSGQHLLHANRAFRERWTLETGAPYRLWLEKEAAAGEHDGLARFFRRWEAGEKPLPEALFSSAEAVGAHRRWWSLSLQRLEEGLTAVIHRDASERVRLAQELRESHALFRHAIDHSRDGVFMYDLEGRVVLANALYAEAFGLTVEGVQGRHLGEILEPELAQSVQEQNLLTLTTGQPLHFELAFDTVQGKRQVLVKKGIYHNHRNEIVGVFGTAQDVSGYESVRQSLEKSERHFRALIENSADRVTLLTAEGRIRYTSPSSQRLFGFDIEELLNSNFFFWVHQGDLDELTRRYRTLLEEPGRRITAEYRSLCANNEWQWMEATMTNLLDDPSVCAVIVNERPISERKRAEEALRRFREIIQSSSDAIISVDRDGVVISWNPAASTVFGYSEKEIRGENLSILVPQEREREYRSLFATAMRNGGAEDVETIWYGKGGRRVDVSLTLSAMRDKERHVVGFSVIIRDITEKRLLEKQILEVSDHEKQRLGQDLHDDLCQHLIGISMLGDLLRQSLERKNYDEAREAAKVTELAKHAVERARNLARGLCQLNLIEEGLGEALSKLATSTSAMFRTAVRFEGSAELEIRNENIANHLYRITQEALHNAVKHSAASEIIIRLAYQPGSGLEISVIDNGSGLPASQKPKSNSGGGLGMHTMRYRARIIGATLDLSANEPQGTIVTCLLPPRKCRVAKEEETNHEQTA